MHVRGKCAFVSPCANKHLLNHLTGLRYMVRYIAMFPPRAISTLATAEVSTSYSYPMTISAIDRAAQVGNHVYSQCHQLFHLTSYLF